MGFLLEVLAIILIPMWIVASVGKALPSLGNFFRRCSGAMFTLCLGLAWCIVAYGDDSKGAFMIPLIAGVAFLFYGSSVKK